jgi:hypothetical protein
VSVVLAAGAVRGQIDLETVPSWRSTDGNLFSTGAAWGDVDGDGFLELAVSNGNDMSADPNLIYDNIGGVLDPTASWSSTNSDYSGKCALGDLDHNGGLDLVVVNYGYPSGGGWAKRLDDLYMSIFGAIQPFPVWNSSPADSDNTFGLDLGDVDGDGDLDLATANGDAYSNTLAPNKVYLNDGTIFESTPSWVSADLGATYDAQWGDVDRDGDLDLAVIDSNGPAKVYRNDGGVLETSPSWTSAEIDDHNTLAWGDMDGDGWLDLAVSTNIQLGGSGRFRVYLNRGGTLSATADWESDGQVYGSGIAWGDADADGDLDLAAGSWWGKSSVYENVDGMLATSPAWQCRFDYLSVVETMAWGDVDADGLRRALGESHPVDGARKLFYLHHVPVHSLDSVYVDGARLDPADYCANPVSGWVSLASAPQAEIRIYYTWSRDLDLAVSNWDRENYVFTNGSASPEDVSVNVVPAAREIAPGDSLRYRATIINNTAAPVQVTTLANVRLPGGQGFGGNPVHGPEVVDLAPFEAVDVTVAHLVPPQAPAGTYTYIFLAGVPPSTLLDREVFTFTVTADQSQALARR